MMIQPQKLLSGSPSLERLGPSILFAVRALVIRQEVFIQKYFSAKRTLHLGIRLHEHDAHAPVSLPFERNVFHTRGN